jgi:F0F1-type ATP synthase assembly protein I
VSQSKARTGKLTPNKMQSGVAAERTSLDPLGAGALLAGVLFACVGAGALIGTLAGSVGVGVAIGAVIGIPAAVFSVYRRYSGVF